MTDRKKSKKKTEFGADREADRVLGKLPRKFPEQPNFFGYIDAAGRLMLWRVDGGLLIINEKDLIKVHGDELADF